MSFLITVSRYDWSHTILLSFCTESTKENCPFHFSVTLQNHCFFGLQTIAIVELFFVIFFQECIHCVYMNEIDNYRVLASCTKYSYRDLNKNSVSLRDSSEFANKLSLLLQSRVLHLFPFTIFIRIVVPSA